MTQKSRIENRWQQAGSPGLNGHGRMRAGAAGKLPETSGEISGDPRFQFDADAWTALLTEQRLRIAAAAGVDPSRVRIQLGH